MVKKNKNKLRNRLGVVALILFAIMIFVQPFSLLDLSKNIVELRDTEKTDNFYTLENEYVEKQYNTRWGNNKQVLLSNYQQFGGISDTAYANDKSDGVSFFCLSYGSKYVSTEKIIAGTRYRKFPVVDGHEKSNKWESGSDKSVATLVTCKKPTGNFVVQSGEVIIKDIAITTEYDGFQLVYDSQLNGGSISPSIVFQDMEYSIDSDSIPFEDMVNKNVDLKFTIVGSNVASPKLFDNYELEGIVDNTTVVEIPIEVEIDVTLEEEILNELEESNDEVVAETEIVVEELDDETATPQEESEDNIITNIIKSFKSNDVPQSESMPQSNVNGTESDNNFTTYLIGFIIIALLVFIVVLIVRKNK